ncbi:hypothetical protein WA158_006171 [Blastocystis sp. Blastoise]
MNALANQLNMSGNNNNHTDDTFNLSDLLSELSSIGLNEKSVSTLTSFQNIASNADVCEDENNKVTYDLSEMNNDAFDMSALVEACKEIKQQEGIEEKVKQMNPLLSQVLQAYDDAIQEGYDNEEFFSRGFLMKLKRKAKGQKRRNQRNKSNKKKGQNYSDKLKLRAIQSKKQKKQRKSFKRIY